MDATMASLKEQLHSDCLLCGAEHPQGFRLEFRTRADGHVEAEFPCDRLYQGYTGYLHGGVIAALLDSAMTHGLFAHGHVGLTGELHVRFLKPVLVNRSAKVSARLVETMFPLFLMESEVWQEDQVKARATAKFMHVRQSETPILTWSRAGR